MKTRLAAICLAALLPAGASAYDPDGFHQCMLNHIKEEMDTAAVVAVRQACAHQNGTTATGGKLEPPEPPVSENSFIRRMRIFNPNLYDFSDRQIIESVMRKKYPNESYSQVKEWLTRDMEIHGPPPGINLKEN